MQIRIKSVQDRTQFPRPDSCKKFLELMYSSINNINSPEPADYRDRSYLSAGEAARYLGMDVKTLHSKARAGEIPFEKAASGQYRFSLEELERVLPREDSAPDEKNQDSGIPVKKVNLLSLNGTGQKIIIGDSRNMEEIPDESVHLMITSPPYFNAKMYSEQAGGDLGNIHDLDEWFNEIGRTWREVFRVLQPGRKAFINIMNLPVRTGKTFRTLNLAGKTIDLMEDIGFIFKRDIVWHKTNGVRAHFGTYPYPGGILINNMHEFILEFNKPDRKNYKKYGHLTKEQKEKSKLDREFWLSLKNSDVWLMKPEKSGDRREHVAPFPYELPERIIRAFSFIGEMVLDPFGGSMITLQAASDLERNGIAYEINPEIVKRAMERLMMKDSETSSG